LQPIKRFNLDAAIIFADILLIAENLNLKLQFEDSVGPIITPTIKIL
jgi:uroporphyrinogen decarboxylase